jgi:uncharacterized Ntn-hydrolase superfamily protein
MLHRLFRTLAAVTLLAAPSLATWSIVVVNTRTGEVCVASATCISGFDLKPNLALIRVGVGGAAAQSVVDQGAVNRMRIWQAMTEGRSPEEILSLLAPQDTQHQRRQYGLSMLRHQPTSFTGTQAGNAKLNLHGIDGDLRWAVQGNLLTGQVVVTAARDALLATPGDLSQKVLAAMDAARSYGGDGRCSCGPLSPTACGAPPASFQFSAATAFLVLARMGDTDGVCNANQGCANGNYFLDIRAISGPPAGPDPIVQLRTVYNTWRAGKGATADHLLTRVTQSAPIVPADGAAETSISLQLVNIDGTDLIYSPATLEVVAEPPGIAVATVTQVVDEGEGRHRVVLRSNGTVGTSQYGITVVHPWKRVRLWPNVRVTAEPAQALVVGRESFSASEGTRTPLWCDFGAAQAGAPYLVLGSASGTTPGTTVFGVQVPLVQDTFFGSMWSQPNSSTFQQTQGLLSANGRARAELVAAPGRFTPLVGRTLTFCSVLNTASGAVSNTDTLVVAP